MQILLGLAALALTVPTMSISSQLDAAGEVHMRTYDDDNDDILVARREDRIDADINSTMTCDDLASLGICSTTCQTAIFECFCDACRTSDACARIEAAFDSGSCDASDAGSDVDACTQEVKSKCLAQAGAALATAFFACGKKAAQRSSARLQGRD